jgi:hypothetical protein
MKARIFLDPFPAHSKFVELATLHVESRTGRVVEVRGDEVLAVFDSAREAIKASVGFQSAMAGEAAESSVRETGCWDPGDVTGWTAERSLE